MGIKWYLNYVDRNALYNYGRDVVKDLSAKYVKDMDEYSVLDIGTEQGLDLLGVASALGKPSKLYGVENHLPYIKEIEKKGITVFNVDLEQNSIPLPDKSMDLIICNQVIEHLKNIFWVFSEISRILKPGAVAVIGFPNLASITSRIKLLFGIQPGNIRVLSPHVRGYTLNAFKDFIVTDGYFKVLDHKGDHFHPLPYTLGRPMSKLFPNLSSSLFVVIQRTEKEGNFIKILDTRNFASQYYTGK